MKHLELLTVESYLESKKELIEDINYTMSDLDIDHWEKLMEGRGEIIERIANKYFKNEIYNQDKSYCVFLSRDCHDVYIGNSIYSNEYDFLSSLKERHKMLMKEGKEKEVASELKEICDIIFMYACRLDGVESKLYEIMKYTLTEERKCDSFDNGNFIMEMEDEDIYPFKKEEDYLPVYCQEMQRVLFGVHRKIFQFSESTDITRFSFYNTRKIIKKVKESLKQRKYEEYTVNYGENNSIYIEGQEDYILLDRILGISLTNIIYWKTKNISKREKQNRITGVVKYLAECQNSIGRNAVAQILFSYLNIMKFNVKVVNIVEKVLIEEVEVWNKYYREFEAAILLPTFHFLKNRPISDYIELCEEIEKDELWSEYIYMKEIIEREKKQNKKKTKKKKDRKSKNKEGLTSADKVRIPKGDMNHRTWYAYVHKLVFESIWRE